MIKKINVEMINQLNGYVNYDTHYSFNLSSREVEEAKKMRSKLR